jgi:hypothetical protein
MRSHRTLPSVVGEVITVCGHLETLRFSLSVPYACTEQGVAMLSIVLGRPAHE